MHQTDRGTDAARAGWWAVLRTERDRRFAARGGRLVTAPNLRRLLSRRLARIGDEWALCEDVFWHISSRLGAKKGNGLSDHNFQDQFKELTDNPPLSWQIRLFQDWFAQGKLPPVVDLPTGLGKTMIMAIWLIARERLGRQIPTRLIYVVDRRTVVDQATDLAMKLIKNWKDKRVFDGEPPAISTLRGQLADKREWSRDPSRPAIIIGTVDLIGSALLFSGYRSSYKRRPLEAGLLGQDSLLVLDEAHLSKPFEKLICAICDDGPHQKNRNGGKQGNPLRVIRMSATSGDGNSSRFKLEDSDLKDDRTIQERFAATKTLTIHTLTDKQKVNDQLADKALELANDQNLRGTRIVVFVRSPDAARQIAERIQKYKEKDFSQSVAVLTGTMRGLERDELVEKPVLKRFLDGDENPFNCPNQRPVFLVSTSAGEVGFDLNADHMVCDATTIDSLIQRLGRVNRRGYPDANAQIHLLVEPSKKKDGKPVELKGIDLAIGNTVKLLANGMSLSPQNIAELKSGEWKDKCTAACSPEPTTVELTDILLDAWSMTSIIEPMPGRPEVGPWLRGIAEWEPPQTEIAWRAELDLDGFADLDLDDIEEWFDTHRALTHETLSVKTSDAATWFNDRWDHFHESKRPQLAKLPVIIDRAGTERLLLGEVITRLSRDSNDADVFLRGAEIVVPASFGGIRRGVGLLDSSEPKLDRDEEKKSPDEQAMILEERQNSIDVADVRGRYREKIKKLEDGDPESTPLDPKAAKPSKYARSTLQLQSDDDQTVRLVSYVPRFEKPETGQKPQTLKQHVCAVRKAVDDIVGRLSLPEDVQLATQHAADRHDHGKTRERWQRLLVFPRDFVKPDEPMGKSGGEMKRDSRGYRHEFGSLREFIDAHKEAKFTDSTGKDITKDAIDLALHLIAVHHGRGRPHFPQGGFDPDCESRSDEIHTESIRRFARLQRKYGWWHLAWLENLLRCADALASSEPEGGE